MGDILPQKSLQLINFEWNFVRWCSLAAKFTAGPHCTQSCLLIGWYCPSRNKISVLVIHYDQNVYWREFTLIIWPWIIHCSLFSLSFLLWSHRDFTLTRILPNATNHSQCFSLLVLSGKPKDEQEEALVEKVERDGNSSAYSSANDSSDEGKPPSE